MSRRSRRALLWLLRLAGVALLAWLLLTQVQWRDRVGRVDGSTVEGEILESRADGTILILVEAAPDGAAEPQAIAAEAIARRDYGGESVRDVSYGARTLIGRLKESIPAVVAVLIALVCLVVLTALRWRLLLRGVGLDMTFGRAVQLTFIGGFFNIAVPGATGGDVVKAWYAARDTGRGTKAVISVFVDRFVGLFGLVLFAAGVLLFTARGAAYEVPRTVVLVVLACCVAGGAVVLSRPLRRALGLAWLVRRLPFQRILGEVRASARLYKHRLGIVSVALGLSLFNHAANATCCWYLARALGIEGIALGTAMALVPLANLLSAIPLLPGGWGVGELAFAYFFGLVGVPPTEAVGLSVVFRIAVLGVSLPGGLLWIFWRGQTSTARIAAEVEEAAARVSSGEEAR